MELKEIEKMLYSYPLHKKYIEIYNIKEEEANLFEDVTLKETLKDKAEINKLYCLKIDKAIELLGEEEKEIIKSKYFNRKRDYEIYLNIGISASNYYARKRKALTLLSELLGD